MGGLQHINSPRHRVDAATEPTAAGVAASSPPALTASRADLSFTAHASTGDPAALGAAAAASAHATKASVEEEEDEFERRCESNHATAAAPAALSVASRPAPPPPAQAVRQHVPQAP